MRGKPSEGSKCRYGYYLTKNHYFLCYDPDKMKVIFDAIRKSGNYTTKCGYFAIKHILDLTTG